MNLKALLHTVTILLILAVAYVSFWVLVIALVGYVIYYVTQTLQSEDDSTRV